jgi:hypothetical protein
VFNGTNCASSSLRADCNASIEREQFKISNVFARSFRIMKLDLNSLPQPFGLPTAARHPKLSGTSAAGISLPGGCLPMTKEKRLAEFIETSLICFLGAMAALLGFVLVWLVVTLADFAHA